MKLAQHTFSSMFGTFLCNSLSERRRLGVTEKTRSVWDYLEHHHVKFRNFLFENRLNKEAVEPLWPRCEVRDLLLWKDVYVVSDHKISSSSMPAQPSTPGANNTSTSSSGLNSRCDDAPPGSSGSDAVDGGSSSREDDGKPANEPPKLDSAVSEKLQQEDEDSGTASILPAMKLKLGRAIESSTDTLVADVVKDKSEHEIQVPEVQSSTNALPALSAANVAKNTVMNCSDEGQKSISSGCPSHCLMGCDLSQYFKEPIDTDGLNAHHNQVQERLVRIFATHQAEVQALRRDLQCTRVALFKQKMSSRNHHQGAGSSGNANDELLSVDMDGKQSHQHHHGGPANGTSGSSSTGACSDASSTWEAVDEKEAKPTLWIPDHAVAACMK